MIVMITHSLGELDVVFPIFSKLLTKEEVDIELIFTVTPIYKDFKQNDFYQFFVNRHKIKSSLYKIYKYKSFNRLSVEQGIESLKNPIFFLNNIFKSILLVPKCTLSKYYMHEYTNQLASNWVLYLFNYLFDKRIIVYQHGHSVDINKKVSKRTRYAEKVKALVFHKHTIGQWTSMGFENQHIVGYPKFYPEWRESIEDYTKNREVKNKFVLIYSRPVHPYYMDKDKYIELLVSSCRTIQLKLEGVSIIIKPHPRESSDFMQKLLDDAHVINFSISNDTTLAYSSSCMLAISFWTSAILEPLSNKVPAIEYYIEADKFREMEPCGSIYKDLGIVSVDNSHELGYFIENLEEIKKVNKKLIKEIGGFSNVQFL